MQSNYGWKVTMPDGTNVLIGENIRGASLVSLIPMVERLPQHDLSGLTFIRRFCRGFLNGMCGEMKEYLHCIVCSECRVYVRSTDGAVLITPADYELYL